MAAPKIFVSSTCYDLYEVRDNIKRHISDFGYEPVMSEFGDIFYAPDIHVQDSCVEAIKKCDMFILIIGDNYGSIYYRDKIESDTNFVPKSVTLKEFSDAILLNIPKIIFINRIVNHDYKNYRKHLDKTYEGYFRSHQIDDSEATKLDLKNKIDKKYPFPNPSYKYIFFFLDKINDLRVGNSIHEFENSGDIKKILVQQWAGYLENSLKSFRDKPSAKANYEQRSFEKLEQVEKLITSLAETLKTQQNTSNESLLSNFINLAEVTKLEDMQKVFDECMDNILYYTDHFTIHLKPRLSFKEKITDAKVKEWVEKLANLANTHKWSQVISITPLFSEFEYSYWSSREDVPIKFIMQLASIYGKSEEKSGIIATIKDKFNKLVDFKSIQKKDEGF